MSPLCQGRICHTRRCTLSHDRPQDISSTALDNFFLILSLLFSASPPFLACFFPPFCFYFYTPLISVPGMKGSSGRLSVYLSVHLHLSTYLSRYALYSFFFILTSTSFIFCSTFLVVVCYHPLASHSRFAPILVSVSIFLSISPRYPSSLLFYSLSLSLSLSPSWTSLCMESSWKIYDAINHCSLEKKNAKELDRLKMIPSVTCHLIPSYRARRFFRITGQP